MIINIEELGKRIVYYLNEISNEWLFDGKFIIHKSVGIITDLPPCHFYMESSKFDISLIAKNLTESASERFISSAINSDEITVSSSEYQMNGSCLLYPDIYPGDIVWIKSEFKVKPDRIFIRDINNIYIQGVNKKGEEFFLTDEIIGKEEYEFGQCIMCDEYMKREHLSYHIETHLILANLRISI
jgi:hypothetical protein